MDTMNFEVHHTFPWPTNSGQYRQKWRCEAYLLSESMYYTHIPWEFEPDCDADLFITFHGLNTEGQGLKWCK